MTFALHNYKKQKGVIYKAFNIKMKIHFYECYPIVLKSVLCNYVLITGREITRAAKLICTQ